MDCLVYAFAVFSVAILVAGDRGYGDHYRVGAGGFCLERDIHDAGKAILLGFVYRTGIAEMVALGVTFLLIPVTLSGFLIAFGNWKIVSNMRYPVAIFLFDLGDH
ncbi:hypothetical protein ACJU26_09010 [Acidithiobacillus sp. M4-SHS-6]|uniref:hypothetical protein n=1 Tax=Acidithiobacillus sp. M4-SHS-6 TaxID=3383024 RepID=UPI0039BE91EF